MPWSIQSSGGKFKVVNKQTGKVMGTHPSKKHAQAQLRALYANVPEARKSLDYSIVVPISKDSEGPYQPGNTPTLIIMRHGGTKFDEKPARYQGWDSSGLSAEGRKATEKVAPEIAAYKPYAVYASDSNRAAESARILCEELKSCQPILRENMRPWDIGDVEGMPEQDGGREVLDMARTKAPNDPLPNGESWNSYLTRCKEGWFQLLNEAIEAAEEGEGPCIAVSHSLNIRVLFSLLEGGQHLPEGYDSDIFSDDDREPPTDGIVILQFDGIDWDQVDEVGGEPMDKSLDVKLVVPIEKAWTDEARKASAEARTAQRSHTEMAKHYRQTGMFGIAGHHDNAADRYRRAAESFKNHNPVGARGYLAEAAQHATNAAKLASSNETVAKLVADVISNPLAGNPQLRKAWTDEARQAAIEARQHHMEVAKTIHEQLGGRKFQVMTGAKNFIAHPEGALSFKLPGNGRTPEGKMVNTVKITLNPNDLYDTEFGNMRGGKYTAHAKHSDIGVEQLREHFEHQTGLRTSLFGAVPSSIGKSLIVPIEKTWSDEAREAAVEARRNKGKQLSVPEQHQRKIEEQNKRMPSAMLGVMGGGHQIDDLGSGKYDHMGIHERIPLHAAKAQEFFDKGDDYNAASHARAAISLAHGGMLGSPAHLQAEKVLDSVNAKLKPEQQWGRLPYREVKKAWTDAAREASAEARRAHEKEVMDKAPTSFPGSPLKESDVKMATQNMIAGLNVAEKARNEARGYTLPADKWHIGGEGGKFFRVDVGRFDDKGQKISSSGAFMVEKKSGEIFNIKGYGVADYNKKSKADIGNVMTANPDSVHGKRWNYLKSLDVQLVIPLEKTWSDAAREASAESRRSGGGHDLPPNQGILFQRPAQEGTKEQPKKKMTMKEMRARANANRRARDEAYRAAGMTKVRGALGGTYYE